MSDEFLPVTPEAPDEDSLPPGVTMLAAAALNAPPPPPDAETASQERALSAYREALLAPRPLHSEPWRTDSVGSLTARITRFFRRLRGK